MRQKRATLSPQPYQGVKQTAWLLNTPFPSGAPSAVHSRSVLSPDHERMLPSASCCTPFTSLVCPIAALPLTQQSARQSQVVFQLCDRLPARLCQTQHFMLVLICILFALAHFLALVSLSLQDNFCVHQTLGLYIQPVHYHALAEACLQCFKPFIEFL